MAFSEQEFRLALGLFPTGVVIATATTGEGERLGMTLSSFNSVSLSPPLILFSINRSAKSFDAWTAVEHYAVNVLSQSQDALSTRFARPSADKWQGLMPLDGETDAPLIPNALATFECVPYAQYDGGDHVIMVGLVISIRRSDTAGNGPLVFHCGRYRELDPQVTKPMPFDDTLWLHGW